jgi:hypothetical protein
MYEDIPDKLVEDIRAIPDFIHFAPEARYIAASMVVINFYLNKTLLVREFIDATDDPDAQALVTSRISSIADCLFAMRSCSGFEEFCRRFTGRDLRSTFFELFAAKFFSDAGFDAQARPEIGVRGEDFDFKAVSDAETVNVEVTALQIDGFARNTILNALHQKRGQLPATYPAVIFCVFHGKWFDDAEVDIVNELETVGAEFLRGTRRINAVVFLSDNLRAMGAEHTVLVYRLTIVENERPRLPITTLDFLRKESPDAELVRRVFLEGAHEPELAATAYDRPFCHWVDSILGPCPSG